MTDKTARLRFEAAAFGEVQGGVNTDHLRIRAQWLEKIAQRYPIDLRTDVQLRWDIETMQIIDTYGAPLLDQIEAKLFPAFKRLRWQGAPTYMTRTVLGTADFLNLEIGIGGTSSHHFGKYEFIVGGFCHPITAILEYRVTHPDGRPTVWRDDWDFIGGLTETPEGHQWFHIPDEAWAAAPMPHLVNFSGLPPLEPVLDPILDTIVRQAVEAEIARRKICGYPLTKDELGPWRRQRGVG